MSEVESHGISCDSSSGGGEGELESIHKVEQRDKNWDVWLWWTAAETALSLKPTLHLVQAARASQGAAGGEERGKSI